MMQKNPFIINMEAELAISSVCHEQLHILFYCTHVKIIWDRLEQYFTKFGDSSEFVLDDKTRILNNVHSKAKHVVN